MKPRPTTNMTKATLRPAISGDEPYLHWLEEACMRDYAVALWGSWRPRPADALILDEHRLIVADGEDAGCVSVTRREDHLWVNKLYVAPAYQKRGYGAFALRQVLGEAALAADPGEDRTERRVRVVKDRLGHFESPANSAPGALCWEARWPS